MEETRAASKREERKKPSKIQRFLIIITTKNDCTEKIKGKKREGEKKGLLYSGREKKTLIEGKGSDGGVEILREKGRGRKESERFIDQIVAEAEIVGQDKKVVAPSSRLGPLKNGI